MKLTVCKEGIIRLLETMRVDGACVLAVDPQDRRLPDAVFLRSSLSDVFSGLDCRNLYMPHRLCSLVLPLPEIALLLALAVIHVNAKNK